MTEPAMQPTPQTSVFRGAVKNISPPWLQGTNGYKFTYSAIGIVLDALAEYFRLGVLQGFPSTAQSSALPFIGRDTQILRGFRETDDAYAARLRRAFPTWKFAGNAQTLMGELAAYFSPSAPVIRYVVNGEYVSGNKFADWWTLDSGNFTHTRTADSPTANNWNWDDDFTKIRFWIIIYRNEGFTPWFWGDGHVWGGGQSWGYEENFTENFAVDARNFIQQWKAAGSHAWRFGGLIVTGDATLFDPSGSGAGYPDGTWATYANRTGIPTTFYLDGI